MAHVSPAGSISTDWYECRYLPRDYNPVHGKIHGRCAHWLESQHYSGACRGVDQCSVVYGNRDRVGSTARQWARNGNRGRNRNRSTRGQSDPDQRSIRGTGGHGSGDRQRSRDRSAGDYRGPHGILQIAFGLLRLGQMFRAVSPAVINGMLAGIGVLILSAQFHVMVDDNPKSSGLENLLSIPDAIMKGVRGDLPHRWAAGIGVLTLLVLIVMPLIRKGPLSKIPAPLAAVVVASLAAWLVNAPIQQVELPSSFLSALKFPDVESLNVLKIPAVWGIRCSTGVCGQRGNAAVCDGGRWNARRAADEIRQGTAGPGRRQHYLRSVGRVAGDRRDYSQHG